MGGAPHRRPRTLNLSSARYGTLGVCTKAPPPFFRLLDLSKTSFEVFLVINLNKYIIANKQYLHELEVYTKYGIFMSEDSGIKKIVFIGSSRRDIQQFPEDVKEDIGYAFFEVQKGGKPASAKPLKGFGGAGVLEIIENFDGNTYRAVYTVKFQKAIYVLHLAFRTF